jgi:hypothetical protein
MKKSTSSSSRNGAAKMAVAAVVLSAPLWSIPGVTLAQGSAADSAACSTDLRSSDYHIKFAQEFMKYKGDKMTIVGLDNGHTIYENGRGEKFYIDPKTGDMKFVSADMYIKYTTAIEKTGRALTQIKFDRKVHKDHIGLRLLGVDPHGNVIQENTRGEKFYLDPTTGDLVFVK